MTARKSPSARLNRPAAGQHEGAAPAGTVRLTAPGQVRWSIEGSETVVWMNTDGDLAADAAIRIAGAPLPGIDHFLL